MDLIVTDKNRVDIGVLTNYQLDLAYGSDENDFEITVSIDNNVVPLGGMIYMDNSVYGGIVDDITVATGDSKIVYHGRTWHGILNSKIIQPDSGQDYLTLSGNANTVLSTLISRLDLGDLLTVNPEPSEINISSYQMNRYIPGYDGIQKMLSANGAKLKMTFDNGMVQLSAEPIHDYTADDEFDSSQLDFTIGRAVNHVNHLICLGTGELSARQVVHIYVDEDGNISNTKHFDGVDEVTAVYDYSSVESLEALRTGGIEKLQELHDTDSLKLELDATKQYDVGDIVGGREQITGIAIAKTIKKAIVSIKDKEVTVEYEL